MWQALIIMFIAMSMIPAGDTAGKLLTSEHGATPLFVAWSRFAIGTFVMLPIVQAGILRLLSDWRIWLRALLLTGGITFIQTALSTIPLADAFAAFFIGPIFSYVLSVAVLGERVTTLRSVLILLGFAGVLVVVRPGFSMQPGMVYAILGGLCYGAYLTSSRWMADIADPRSLLFTQLALSSIILTPFCWNTTPPLTIELAGLTMASALFSMGGNFLLLIAYARAPASSLAPYVYFQLLAAVALGWVVFGDLPDGVTILGLCLIVGAGIASAALAGRKG